MDLWSCWQTGSLHKCYRSTEDLQWNEERGLLKYRPSPAVSRCASFSFDDVMNDETLLSLSDSLCPLLETDQRFRKLYQFLCSEKNYLDQIRSALDIYAEPLRKFSSLTAEDMQILFSDLESLVHCSHDLCRQLRSAADNWDSKSTQIGHLFSSDFWSVHNSYLSHYTQINRLLLDKQLTNSEFAGFCHMRELSGKASLDSLLRLPTKRMASRADELKEMIVDLDANHPDMPYLAKATNEANRMMKLTKGNDNENCMIQIQHHFPHDDLRLLNRDVPSSAASRWKSAISKSLGGKKLSIPVLGSHVISNSSTTTSDANCHSTERYMVLGSQVKLTVGTQTRRRYLFLFNDCLIIAKRWYEANFRLKNKIPVCNLWIAPCSEKTLIVGWPIQNVSFTFENKNQKDLWQMKLNEMIKAEKTKEVPQSIQIKIVKKDSIYTAIKSLMVANNETAGRVVERCLDEFHIADAVAADFQLCVILTEDDTTISLSGHEYPYTIWMNNTQTSSADSKVLFSLRSNKKATPKFVIGEPSKPSRKGLKRLFAKPSSKQDNVKLFGRDLGELCVKSSRIPHPVMQMLMKLYSDGPKTDGIFRKSANHAKLLEVRQSLDGGESVNFDEISVLLTAVLLKEFLRSLPNCLLNCQLYPKWIEAVSIKDSTERITSIKRLIHLLPPCNQLLLRYLMCILYSLAKNSDQCKMDSFNLAVCVTQSLLWSGASVAQKEEIKTANLLVQQMIDSAKDIFGPECLTLFEQAAIRPKLGMIRGFSADSDSTGAAEDTLWSSHDFDQSCSEADCSPVVKDKPHFQMQSSQSCDSGLQLGDEVHESNEVSSSGSNLLTSLESGEGEESKQKWSKKLRRSKKREAHEIPVMHQSSSTDALLSLQSSDSLCLHSVESPVVDFDGHSMQCSKILPMDSNITSSNKFPFFIGPKTMLFIPSVDLSSKPFEEPFSAYSSSMPSNQSVDLTYSPDSAEKQENLSINESDYSYKYFRQQSEGSSDAEFGKVLGDAEKQDHRTDALHKNSSRNVDSNMERPSLNLVQRMSSDVQQNCGDEYLNFDLPKRRPPPLRQLHGTVFAKKCVETPEELKEDGMTWVESSRVSSTFGTYRSLDSDVGLMTPDGKSYSLSSGYSTQRCDSEDGCSEQMDSSRQQSLVSRQLLTRTNAVESDADKPKQGVSTTRDLFPSQIRIFLSRPTSVDDESQPSLASVSSRTSAAEQLQMMHASASEPRIWKGMTTLNMTTAEKLPTYEEAAVQQKGGNRPLLENTAEMQSEKRRMAKQLFPYCKSLNDMSVGAVQKTVLDPVRQISPLKGFSSARSCQASNLNAAMLKDIYKPEFPRTKDDHLDLVRGECQIPHGKCQTTTTDLKPRDSSSCRALDTENHPSLQELNNRPRSLKKRGRNRHVRKRNSDPRMTKDKPKGSELGRSKSDSSELCWKISRQSHQVNSRSCLEREYSKENIAREDSLEMNKCERSPQSFTAKDISVLLRDANQNSKNCNRKSLTVKDKDWHKELTEQYTNPATFSASKKAQSSPTHQFGRELKESVAVSFSQDSILPCFNNKSPVTVSCASDDNSGGFTNRGLRYQHMSRGFSCDNSIADFKWSNNKDCSGLKARAKLLSPRQPGSSWNSESNLKKSPDLCMKEQKRQFLAAGSISHSPKISDDPSKVAFGNTGPAAASRGNIRPSCETVFKAKEDAELLHPNNISWSVAKLKEFYASNQASSTAKSAPLSHSRSDAWNFNRRAFPLHQDSVKKNPH